MNNLPTYPRTLHLGDSGRRQSKHQAPFSSVAEEYLVVEEKVDGSHTALFFDQEANLKIFFRQTEILSPEPPFLAPLVAQAQRSLDGLWDTLGDRYVLFGEWSYAVHTIYYDALPSYFLEDDIFDRHLDCFLSTDARHALAARLPEDFSHSVRVLAQGTFDDLESIRSLIGRSTYCSSSWENSLKNARQQAPSRILDSTGQMEGLYIKSESEGIVQGRYKWIRPSFLDLVLSADSHWKNQKFLANGLIDAYRSL